jgi:hypothetical protein
MLAAHTSWPVAKITDTAGRVVGCVIPEAPAKYRDAALGRFLEIDWLCVPDSRMSDAGLVPPTFDERLTVARGLAEIGAFFERRRLVYSDWSYSNAFWSASDHAVYVIDVDECAAAPVGNLHHPNWEDPLTPSDTPADLFTDRYRLALLVARCLTGRRDVADVLDGIDDLEHKDLARVSRLLREMLRTADRSARPAVGELNAALIEDANPVHGSALRPKALPVYLVIDASASMARRAMDLNNALEDFRRMLAYSPAVSDLVRLSVIAFNGRAQVLLEMSEVAALPEMPTVMCDGPTHFGAMFDLVRERSWPPHPHIVAYGIDSANPGFLSRISTIAAFVVDAGRSASVNEVLGSVFDSVVTSARTSTVRVSAEVDGFTTIRVARPGD